MCKADSVEKPLMLGKIEEKRVTENEIAGWNHRLSEYEFDQTLGVREGQGSLLCCSPWVTNSET